MPGGNSANPFTSLAQAQGAVQEAYKKMVAERDEEKRKRIIAEFELKAAKEEIAKLKGTDNGTKLK